jgi:Ca2+-binding EF-hand superfamily protein
MSFPRKSGLTGLVAGVLALGLATTALAQGGPGQPGPGGERPSMGREGGPAGGRHGGRHASRQLEILDTDGNGSASREEISGELGRLLGAADVDGDGQLSPDEFRRRGSFFIRLGTTTFFDLIDTNGDQQISDEELNQPMERWFARRDSNSDGNVDAEEFNQERRSFGGRRHR